MTRALIRSLLTLCCLFYGAAGWSQEISVIVNPANPLKVMTKDQVSDLYFGRTKAFPNGEFALVFDQVRDCSMRGDFFKSLAGVPLSQVNVYWSRLMFSGRVLPPQALLNDNAVIEVVRHNPGAIGYVRNLPKDSSVRVVLLLKE
jgi:hypothetical protein